MYTGYTVFILYLFFNLTVLVNPFHAIPMFGIV